MAEEVTSVTGPLDLVVGCLADVHPVTFIGGAASDGGEGVWRVLALVADCMVQAGIEVSIEATHSELPPRRPPTQP